MRTIRLDSNIHSYRPIKVKEIVNIVANGELKGQFIGVDSKVRQQSCSICALKGCDVRCRLRSGGFICGECAGLEPLESILEAL